MKKALQHAKKLKKIIQVLYSLLVGMLVVVAGLIILSSFDTPVKMRLFAVLSGSMEPTMPVGSLAVVFPQSTYTAGDIITVRGEKNPKETVTHRIIDIRQQPNEQNLYVLKGDANEEQDREAIPENRVVGKVLVHLPYLGRMISFAQTQQGFILMIVVPATILLYSELVAMKKEVGKILTKKKTKHKTLIESQPVEQSTVQKSEVQMKPEVVSIIERDVLIHKPVHQTRSIPMYEQQITETTFTETPATPVNTVQQKIKHVLYIEDTDQEVIISV